MGLLSTFIFVVLPSVVIMMAGSVLIRTILRSRRKMDTESTEDSEQSGTRLREAINILNTKGEAEFCAHISALVKSYLDDKYQMGTERMTVGEIISKLQGNLSNIDADYTGEILRMCEMVQDYGYKPSKSELRHIYQLAYKLTSEREENAETK